MNSIAIFLILFAQLDVDALAKAITDIGERLTKLERLLPKDDTDELTPIPSGDGLQLLDSRGQAITEIKDGRQFRIVAPSAGKWSLKTLSPDADVDVTESPSQLVCTLRNGAGLFVAHVTETGGDLTTIIVQCGHGPQPPPKPIDPVEPDKPKLGMRVLMLYESSQNHSAKQDLILNSFTTGKINDAVVARVTKDADGRPNWRRWDVDLNVDTSSAIGKLFAETKAKAVQRGLPALVIALGDDATIFQIPADANEDQVLAAIEGAK